MKSHSRPKTTIDKSKANSTMKLTPEEIYNISNRKIDWGIEEYEVPKHYYDYNQIMWKKHIAELVKKCPRQWPPKDWPSKPDDKEVKVPPKRWNYLDDLTKWCNSFYNKEKADELLSIKPIVEYKPTKRKDNRRTEFLKNEKERLEREKNKKFYLEEKEDLIAEIKERAEEDRKKNEIPFEKKMKAKYKGGRCQSARCDKVTCIDEVEFLGEETPFYKTALKEDEEKSKQKLFYPDKTCYLRKYPSWKFNTLKKKNENLEAREQLFKEKNEELMNQRNLSAKDLWVNISKAYHDVTHHGEILMKIHPKIKYNEEEHYISFRENNPIVHVGPQQYWKVPKPSRGKSSKKKVDYPNEDEKGNKAYYMDINRTYQRIYKSGIRKCVF